jgi:hypothetical protein
MAEVNYSFKMPKSIGDEQEFGIGKLPFFFTRQEWGLIAMTVIGAHLFSMLVAPNALIQLIMSGLVLSAFVTILSGMRKGKPTSYIWDFQYRMGSNPGKGWYRYDKKRSPTPIVCQPSQRRSTFVPNRKLGDRGGFLIDDHLRVSLPRFGKLERPLFRPKPLFPPRLARHMVFGDGASSDCPLWWRSFEGDQRYADVEQLDLEVSYLPVRMNEKQVCAHE